MDQPISSSMLRSKKILLMETNQNDVQNEELSIAHQKAQTDLIKAHESVLAQKIKLPMIQRLALMGIAVPNSTIQQLNPNSRQEDSIQRKSKSFTTENNGMNQEKVVILENNDKTFKHSKMSIIKYIKKSNGVKKNFTTTLVESKSVKNLPTLAAVATIPPHDPIKNSSNHSPKNSSINIANPEITSKPVELASSFKYQPLLVADTLISDIKSASTEADVNPIVSLTSEAVPLIVSQKTSYITEEKNVKSPTNKKVKNKNKKSAQKFSSYDMSPTKLTKKEKISSQRIPGPPKPIKNVITNVPFTGKSAISRTVSPSTTLSSLPSNKKGSNIKVESLPKSSNLASLATTATTIVANAELLEVAKANSSQSDESGGDKRYSGTSNKSLNEGKRSQNTYTISRLENKIPIGDLTGVMSTKDLLGKLKQEHLNNTILKSSTDSNGLFSDSTSTLPLSLSQRKLSLSSSSKYSNKSQFDDVENSSFSISYSNYRI